MKHKIKFKIFWREGFIEINLERLDTVFWITFIAISSLKNDYLLTEKDFLINPFNDEKLKVIIWDYFKEEIRVWIPAHNEKDFEFAKKNNLEIRQVIAPVFMWLWNWEWLPKKWLKTSTAEWVLVNSNKFNNLTSEEAEIKLLELAKNNWFLVEDNEKNNILEIIENNIQDYFLDKYKLVYIKKFFNWIKLHFYFNFHNSNTTRFKKYEIYWINFWVNIWTEFWEKRPWIIFKSNKYVRWKDIVVLPITSFKNWKKYWELDIRIIKNNINNLRLNSIVKLEHIKSISKSRIGDYIWKLNSEDINIIEEKVIKMLLQ